MARQQRRTAKQWERLIDRFKRSGLNLQAYCRQESIHVSSFYRWRSQLDKALSASTESSTAGERSPFIELGALPSGGCWEVELSLGDGLSLRLRRR